MNVNLDIFELGYLLDSCLRGSHLRTTTIDKFVNEFYDMLTEQQRYNLYEWSLRLTYRGEFKPSSTSCGSDVIFMHRYDPENQYEVSTCYKGKEEKFRAFKMDGKYYVKKNRFIDDAFITDARQLKLKINRSDFELAAKVRR